MPPVIASGQQSAISDQPSAAGCAGGTNGCGAPTTLTPISVKKSGKEYWRSVEDLADTPEFHEFVLREFPAAGDILESNDRRQFLKIMGASIALAGAGGLTGCRRWPETHLAPYAHRPPDRTPGVPQHYATSMDVLGVGAGLLITSYDGRPIKIEGNPEHPVNRGASTALMQASILDLYDPDRSQKPLLKEHESDWATFVEWAKTRFAEAKSARGSGIAVLCEATSSPSVMAMKQRLLAAFPSASWHEYEAINNDNEVRGSMLAFGGVYRPMYAFDKAKTIVSLDSDFLGIGAPGSVKWIRDYAAGRKCDDAHDEPNRLYAFEGVLSLTGANADHRVALSSSDVARLAMWLASQVGVQGVAAAASPEVATLAPKAEFENVLHHLVDDLKNRGPSIVIAGSRQPAEVHLLAHLMNRALGNVGRTVTYAKMDDVAGVEPHAQSIKALADKINGAGDLVKTLVIIGGNPAHNAPADLGFATLIKRVEATVHLSDYVDETSRLCTWHINRAHPLEAWGDARSYDGTWGITQPLIQPIFEGKTPAELFATLMGDTVTDSYGITRAVFAANSGSGANDEARWRKALHDGFVENSAFAAGEAPAAVGADIASHMQALDQRLNDRKGEIEVVFAADPCMYDGRFANNGWLQELPDPISKLVWDNAVLLSATAAKTRGVKTGDMVSVACNGREVQAAVMIVPGTHDNVAQLALGYDRNFDGRVAKDAGFDFYPLRTSETMDGAGATIKKVSGSYVLATTQDHHAIDSWPAGTGTQERMPTLFRETDVGYYRGHPQFAKHRAHIVTRLSLFPEDKTFHSQTAAGTDMASTGNYAWGLTIDLNACTGCNACVIACQAENNIAIVGKEQVKRGREMHWIRIDRYFKGTSEANPNGYMLAPVTCMHCENAPCEQVCPVAATTHDDDGLNVMVYNRCVGTRYCSNNCPYKVRRFNYFDWWGRGPLREQPHAMLQVETDYYTKGQAKADPLRQLGMNPEVSIRMRGIMEKCTYCIQRIARARIDAKNTWVRTKNLNPNDPAVKDLRVPVADGSFTTACAQACPAQAITFGDLNDRNSAVRKMQKNPRAYEMLEELNTKPRTQYLAKIRNPAFGGEAAANGHGHGADSHAPATSGGHG